jgi:heptaprenyl diphosphate synthase
MVCNAQGKVVTMKSLDRFRDKRRKVYEGLFSAKALCIAGLIIMPALLFNPFIPFRILQFLLFWFLAWLSGKKNNPIFTILIIFFITALNLIVPYGAILYSIGKFKITAGALMVGIQRAVTLEGLIMLSRVTIRRDLKIPGLFGEMIAESFRIFSVIMNQRHRITRKNLMNDIDQMMLDLSGNDLEIIRPDAPAPKTKPAGFVIIVLTAILSWLPWILFVKV